MKHAVLLSFALILLIAPVVRAQFPDGHRAALGPLYQGRELTSEFPHRDGHQKVGVVRHWNQIAIDAIGLDHTPVRAGEARVFGEQLGPSRSSRALAIVHIAMFDAANAIAGGYRSYTQLPRVTRPTSFPAAISQAANDTLATMYPSQAPLFATRLMEELNRIPETRKKMEGVKLGHAAAAAIIALRSSDGSHYAEPRVGIEHITSPLPGYWRQDPISLIPLALGAYWDRVIPFTMERSDQFRVPPPPALSSPEYAAAFDEVKRLGGDGIITPTERTEDQTVAAIYWGYDGTPSLGAPPRLYNQIAVQLARQRGTGEFGLVRLLALINVALADTGIAIWESKYYYNFWRPVIAIREADAGTGPTGAGDGNAATTGDLNFVPLGAPASNLTGPNFTPPFPAYPSGHAGFGGAAFQMFRRFYRTDNIAFTFLSDEYNGVTKDNEGYVRPLLPRSFSSLSQAEEENGQSRIYLGIHWSFDKVEGIAQGRTIANHVFDHALQPMKRASGH